MVDIETGRVVDIFESRESGDVVAWLKTYPNIQVVSRDGSRGYASAISQAHPNAVQVSDRFHLIKHITEDAAIHIKRIVGARFRIPAEPTQETSGFDGYWEKPERHGPDLPQRLHDASTQKRAAIVNRVRELAAQGLNVNRIAKECGLGWTTAKKYMDEAFDPEWANYGVRCPSKLDPYATEIAAMLRSGCKFREIEEAIRKSGYDGAASTIRMYATRERKRIKAAADKAMLNTELVERKWLQKLLYQPIEKVKGLTQRQLDRIICEYPAIGQLYDIVSTFKSIVFSKRVNDLDSWIESTYGHGFEEIDSFIGGITRDLDAVKNAIRFEYNNGLAEGSANKLKVIKRIMYGRHSFDLLRNKLLWLEFNH
jgi:hypothetical protein